MKALKNVRDIQVISELLKMQDFTKKIFCCVPDYLFECIIIIFIKKKKKTLDGDFFFRRFLLYFFHEYVVLGFFNRPNVTKN